MRLRPFLSRFLVPAVLFCSASAWSQVINVTVDASQTLNPLTSDLVGAWSNLGDGYLTDSSQVKLMRAAGLTAITYPTGFDDFADLYHWSTNQLTPHAGNADALRNPYRESKNDFASVAVAMGKVGIRPVVHINYGSNLAGTGGGEPKEAAAWVAYANGSPSDGKEIGKDSTGTDWKTVGYWAKMRSEAPLSSDDGYNFLRVEHPEPFHVDLWQVGEDEYQNGYYGGDHKGGFDLHAPYPASQKDNEKRRKLAQLSPRTYGEQFLAFAAAMKAVDPGIRVGATLATPAIDDYKFAEDWNPAVLKAACKEIDFVAYNWHPGYALAPDYKRLDDSSVLGAVYGTFQDIIKESQYQAKTSCPAGKVPRVVFSQFSQVGWPQVEHPMVLPIFAADMFGLLGESGISNANWWQLRDGSMFDKDKPTPIYYGIQMMHIVAFQPGDKYVAATARGSIDVHAAVRQNGIVGVMLINKDPAKPQQVKVTFAGVSDLAATAVKFDYSAAQQTQSAGPAKSSVNLDGVSVTVAVPAYGIVDLLIPRKK
jgi:hypothetical protein